MRHRNEGEVCGSHQVVLLAKVEEITNISLLINFEKRQCPYNVKLSLVPFLLLGHNFIDMSLQLIEEFWDLFDWEQRTMIAGIIFNGLSKTEIQQPITVSLSGLI